MVTSEVAYVYPSAINGKYVGVFDEALVECNCPALFSMEQGKRWDLKIHLRDEITLIGIAEDFPEPFQQGVPCVDVFQFDIHTPENWDEIPSVFKKRHGAWSKPNVVGENDILYDHAKHKIRDENQYLLKVDTDALSSEPSTPWTETTPPLTSADSRG